MANEKKEFLCPICGSTEYESQIIIVHGVTAQTKVEHTCSGCSIKFGDPEKITIIAKKIDEKLEEVATSIKKI